MKLKKLKNVIGSHPIISFLYLTAFIVVISTILYIFNVASSYQLFSISSLDYTPVTEVVVPLFNLSGLKYIFTNSVSNFANFSAFINFLIVLMGIGILDKSGFLKTAVTLLTKKAKKNTVTFVIILMCLFSSVIGDISYLILLPLIALFFHYAKRSPLLGLIITYASLSVGTGLTLVFTAVDSTLMNFTLLNASVLQTDYSFGLLATFFINIIIILLTAYVLTRVTETHVAKKLPKYDFPDTLIEETVVSKKHMKAMILSLVAGGLYVFVIVYNIIPGLPFSGNLLDYSQELYIDQLFSVNSFFSNGFVFIITFLFIILGLVFGIRSKTIKNDKDFIDSLGFALDGIGKIILMIFVASICISVLSVSNIGQTVTSLLAGIVSKSNFIALPLVLLLLLVSMISTILLPVSADKWLILSSSFVPAFMNAGLTPEFAQTVFRLGESVTMGLTPFLAYFVIYVALLQRYNQSDEHIGLFQAIKYQLPYALAMFVIVVFVIVLFFVTNLPLGIGGAVSL